MNKIYGATGRQDGLYLIGRNKWELIYGYGKDDNAEFGYNYRQRFTRKPTPDEIKEVIKTTVNEATSAKILSGFVWKEIPVWLSMEQQANFSQIGLGGVDYPLELKLGEAADGTPYYYTFESAEEFADFSKAVTKFIIETVQAGWREKDELDKNMDAFAEQA
jgi:hypothetical protein